MYNGLLIVDKPQDWTSHDVVAKIRGILRQKSCGHAGTLDPLATGVLVVLLGSATKASDYAAQKSKEYTAGLLLGVKTDTQDITGRVTRESAPESEEALRSVLPRFEGRQKQLPPMYSAISVGGKRLYELARKGREVEREEREIEIEKLELTRRISEREYEIKVRCSKGTYIRTLCNDIGDALGCGGCMSALRRTSIGAFSERDAVSLAEIQELHDAGRLEERIISTDKVFSDIPFIVLNGFGEKRAENGAFLDKKAILEGEAPPVGALCRVYRQNGDFLLLAQGRELDRGGVAAFPFKRFG